MMPMKGDGCTYRPKAGEVALISGPHCDNEDGYTYAEMEVLWADALFCIARSPGYWPCVWKWEHIRSKPVRRSPGMSERKDGEWKPIETAPRDGTAFQARIPSHGDDNIIMWDCSIEHKDGDGWGTWMFASDQEPPDCWSDGWCWTVNEDGDQSVLPTHWKPLPVTEAMDAEERG